MYPDPFGPGTFWPGRIRIRNNLSGSGSDLVDKKICIIFANFSWNGPIRLWLHTYFHRKSLKCWYVPCFKVTVWGCIILSRVLLKLFVTPLPPKASNLRKWYFCKNVLSLILHANFMGISILYFASLYLFFWGTDIYFGKPLSTQREERLERKGKWRLSQC
jgi:hypothetical protein